MTLATVDADGAPDARMVLLKGVDADGFRFFTNYESAKAAPARRRGAAAIVAYWRELDRSVRARGSIERLGADDVGRLLRDPAARLPARRLGLAAIAADRVREELDATPRRGRGALRRRRRAAARALGRLPCCARETIEFWQGQVGRLHDRFRYTREGEGWRIERLGP